MTSTTESPQREDDVYNLQVLSLQNSLGNLINIV